MMLSERWFWQPVKAPEQQTKNIPHFGGTEMKERNVHTHLDVDYAFLQDTT